ncbi:Hsp70 family protein, partial [Candidatus Hakubella thermalkaliphila]
PTKRGEIFTTAEDSQTSVEIHVLQGERELAVYNKTLGRFQLVGIPPAPRGIPQIEVTFDIDADGIVHVSAKDMATGNEQKITITASSGLSEEEIEKMIKEAQAHAEEDKRRKQLVEAKNHADNLIYSTEKSLRDIGDKIDPGDRKRIEDAIAELKKIMDTDDIDRLKRATDALLDASHKLAEAVYAKTSAQQQSTTGGQQASSQGPRTDEEEVVDTDFEVVDEEENK